MNETEQEYREYELRLQLTVFSVLQPWTSPASECAGFIDPDGRIYRPILQWERTANFGTPAEDYEDLTDDLALDAGLEWEYDDIEMSPLEEASIPDEGSTDADL